MKTIAALALLALSCAGAPPQLPSMNEEAIAKAMTIYGCIVQMQRETQKAIDELCPGAENSAACPALPELLLGLQNSIQDCQDVAE